MSHRDARAQRFLPSAEIPQKAGLASQAAEARRPEGHVPDRPRGARGQGGPLAAQARGFSKKEEEPPTSRLPLATNRAIFCAVFQRYTAGRGPFV